MSFCSTSRPPASIALQLWKSSERFRSWDASETKLLCAQFTSLALRHSRSVIVWSCLLMDIWCTKASPVRVANISTCRLKAGTGIHATTSCVSSLSTIRNNRQTTRRFNATWRSIRMNKKRRYAQKVKISRLVLWTSMILKCFKKSHSASSTSYCITERYSTRRESHKPCSRRSSWRFSKLYWFLSYGQERALITHCKASSTFTDATSLL